MTQNLTIFIKLSSLINNMQKTKVARLDEKTWLYLHKKKLQIRAKSLAEVIDLFVFSKKTEGETEKHDNQPNTTAPLD